MFVIDFQKNSVTFQPKMDVVLEFLIMGTHSFTFPLLSIASLSCTKRDQSEDHL